MDQHTEGSRSSKSPDPTGACRAFLSAVCVAGTIAGGSPIYEVSAEPIKPATSHTARGADPAAQLLRLGALSDRLFESAERSRWSAAQETLQALREQVGLLNGAFEQEFLGAGGYMDDLCSARNGLKSELTEADVAAAAREPFALGQSAHRMTLTIGGLAEPVAEAIGAPISLKVYAATHQAQRMLVTLVWGDRIGYASAHGKFRRLWLGMRNYPGLDPVKVASLDRTLAQAAFPRSEGTVRELQRAAHDAVGTFGVSSSLQP